MRRKILQSQQNADMAGVAIRAAEREFARAQTSWDQRIISQRDYQRAQDELDEAKLTHHHAVETAGLEKEGLEFELQTRRLQRDRQQLLVEDLERRVGELAVNSPVDGMVGNLAVTQKAAVQQDAALLDRRRPVCARDRVPRRRDLRRDHRRRHAGRRVVRRQDVCG